MANKIMISLAAVFLLLGLGSLIVGIIVPITLHNKLVKEGRSVSKINSEDAPSVWANIPGDRGYNLTQEYEFFEISNPDNYKYGIKPQAKSVGTVKFSEKRETISNIESSEVVTYENKSEIAFTFTQRIDLDIIEGDELLNKRIMAINPEVYAVLDATRDASPWYVAIRAMKTMIDFTFNEYYNRTVAAQMGKENKFYIDETEYMNNRGSIFVKNGIEEERARQVFTDSSYGFSGDQNVRFWAKTCDSEKGGFNKKILMDYFQIDSTAMNPFLTQFCSDWNKAKDSVNKIACITSNCKSQEIFYKQWSQSALSMNAYGYEGMNHLNHIYGRPEINLFKNEIFLEGKSEAIKEQFKNVDFLEFHQSSGNEIELNSLSEIEFRMLQSEYTYSQNFDPDTISMSLYNFTTVKRLFEIGMEIDESTTSTIDLNKFNELTSYLHFDKKEMFLVYKWLQHIASVSYLQISPEDEAPLHQSKTDKSAFGKLTPPLFEAEIQNFMIDFGSEYIGRALYKYFKLDDCATIAKKIFTNVNINNI
jgi:hypothetical protein